MAICCAMVLVIGLIPRSSALIAPVVRLLARSSSTCPKRTKTVITAAASKYTGTAYVRYEFNQTFLKNTWVMFATKYLGEREAELITVATNTGAITVDRRLVPTHYLYDLSMGYRYKVGRYNTSIQLNLANLADDDKFYGAGAEGYIDYPPLQAAAA